MGDFSRETTITLDSGDVEYSAEKAAVPIDDLIQTLEEAKDEGAEHVVLLSGNYRGAQYMRLRASYDWLED